VYVNFPLPDYRCNAKNCHSGWLVGFVSPYMINPDAGALGGKVGFVFAGLGVPLCILFYFLMPETRGLSFEEVGYLLLLSIRMK
jgi:hypothetical protein